MQNRWETVLQLSSQPAAFHLPPRWRRFPRQGRALGVMALFSTADTALLTMIAGNRIVRLPSGNGGDRHLASRVLAGTKKLEREPEPTGHYRVCGRRAALRAWRERAAEDAAWCPSRLSAREVACERRADGFERFPLRPAAEARFALARVEALAPLPGGGSFTPALRAFDKPIAIACLLDRAPCFPCRICRISSSTNAPA